MTADFEDHHEYQHVQKQSLPEIMDIARRVSVEWSSTSDQILNDRLYTMGEQVKNDHEIGHLKNLIGKVINENKRKRLNFLLHKDGVTGWLVKGCGTALLWYLLFRWSRIFLWEKSQVKLGEPQRWFTALKAFEQLLERFHSWLIIKYPNYSNVEYSKSCRIIWMSYFMNNVYGRFGEAQEDQPLNHEISLFAFALLYPLVDDYIDNECNDETSREFVYYLKTTVSGSSSFPDKIPSKWQFIGEIVTLALSPFTGHSSDRHLLVSLIEELLNLELQRKPVDLIYYATCKGGFCLLIMSILLQIEMNSVSCKELMKLGLSVQIVDDLKDAQQDLTEHNSTIATVNIYSSAELRRQYSRSINFIRHGLFAESLHYGKLDLKEGMKRVLSESLVLLCMESAAKSPSLQPQDRVNLAQHSPLSINYLRHSDVESSIFKLCQRLK